MDLSKTVLGSNVAKQLADRVRSAVLTVGSDTFSRRDLARIDCFNFTAAANLSALLTTHLKVKDTRDVYFNVSPILLALPRLGAISLAVLGAAFEAKRLGGEAALENWYRQHQVKVITFNGLKLRDERERSEERKRTKQRKQQRRDQAHGMRLVRHEKRAGVA